MKKQYWSFSTRSLSYFWDFGPHRKRIRRKIAGYNYPTDWAACIDDVNYFYVPVSRVRKPKKKKIYKDGLL